MCLPLGPAGTDALDAPRIKKNVKIYRKKHRKSQVRLEAGFPWCERAGGRHKRTGVRLRPHGLCRSAMRGHADRGLSWPVACGGQSLSGPQGRSAPCPPVPSCSRAPVPPPPRGVPRCAAAPAVGHTGQCSSCSAGRSYLVLPWSYLGLTLVLPWSYLGLTWEGAFAPSLADALVGAPEPASTKERASTKTVAHP
jgi:hypothetical protein